MTWENTKRQRAKQRQRSQYHQDRIAGADTAKQKLSAACQWLISEAWQAGRVGDVHEWVIAKVTDIRKEQRRDDEHAA